MDFILNGRRVSIDVEPGTSLLELLREGFGLRSMKDGCAPEGTCGACTVLVDGRPVVSCARDAVRCEGREDVTLEGLPDAARSAWADAFVATGASQCGFCSPGIVMKAEGLLQRGVAAAMVGMQVGVDDARERLVGARAERAAHECERLRGVVHVAGVDQHRTGLARRRVDEQVVRRQPAALEYRQPGERVGG